MSLLGKMQLAICGGFPSSVPLWKRMLGLFQKSNNC